MGIELREVSKTFELKNRRVEALKQTDLSIKDGEIFGLIGFSGAGKSTLLRLINLLERPTSGSVIVNGVVLDGLSEKELRARRQKIGMIFQQFNLIESKTVYENIEFVLKASKYDRSKMADRVNELLELVGLTDKKHSWPKNLSGGQKQRVGIARALANEPEVLLCDEATSALDPDTTKNILKLLKKINHDLGITIVLITHEMEVIKEVADRVGVMSDGEIIETNDVYSIFSHPQHDVTKGFVQDIYDFVIPSHIRETDSSQVITIKFLDENAEANYVNQLYRHFDLDISILNGRIEYINGMPLGFLMLHVQGDSGEIGNLRAFIAESKGIEEAEIYE
ncbi:methionine ABC transporter ATP-binding protein [Salinicoccus sediminis]|uniref:Methionine ABC transporter ATP-binding protein n=1 Tax=Salinicoccus sediminis TaxID=1432562 RepID=A0A0M2SNY2_9STAP|nr:ATP-binding cassette domain-containing protein [Salinicoccus sediminis]KKK35386.1 methionine ABC transporter ATP-binding protein [Salinicoccus sediminis]